MNSQKYPHRNTVFSRNREAFSVSFLQAGLLNVSIPSFSYGKQNHYCWEIISIFTLAVVSSRLLAIASSPPPCSEGLVGCRETRRVAICGKNATKEVSATSLSLTISPTPISPKSTLSLYYLPWYCLTYCNCSCVFILLMRFSEFRCKCFEHIMMTNFLLCI